MPTISDLMVAMMRKKAGTPEMDALMRFLTPSPRSLPDPEMVEPGGGLPPVPRPVNPWGPSPPVVGTDLAQVLEGFFRVKPEPRRQMEGASSNPTNLRDPEWNPERLLGPDNGSILGASNATPGVRQMYINPYMRANPTSTMVYDFSGAEGRPKTTPATVAHELSHAAGRSHPDAYTAGDVAEKVFEGIGNELDDLLVPPMPKPIQLYKGHRIKASPKPLKPLKK